MTDPADMATGGVLGIIGTAFSGLGVQWLRSRSGDRRSRAEEREAEEHTRAAQAAADASVVAPLLARLKELDEKVDSMRKHVDECEDGRRRDREEHAEQRRRDRAECEREIAALRVQVSRLASAAADTRAADVGEDDTGVHHLRAIASDSRPEMPAMPAPARHNENENEGTT